MLLLDHKFQVWSLKHASDFTIHVKCQVRSCWWHLLRHGERTNPEETRAVMSGEAEESKARERQRKAC